VLVLRHHQCEIRPLRSIDPDNKRSLYGFEVIRLEIRVFKVDRDHLRLECRALHVVLFSGGEAAPGLPEVDIEVRVARAHGREGDEQGAVVTGGLVVEVLELTLLHEA
jgi:hypothetical protein